jgi:hypothetical protein
VTKEELTALAREAIDVLGRVGAACPKSTPFPFAFKECPLDGVAHDSHYYLSAAMFGPGWGWTCGFCGADFEE